MGRRLRHFEPGTTHEITARTLHGRFLLRPSPLVNAVIAGVIGRAQRRYGMVIHGLDVLSNHEHLLVTPTSPRQLAGFMAYVNGNIARKIGRMTGWRGKVWERRYQAIPVSNEEPAQVERLRYLLAQGVKEGLVARPQDWPGVHCARALLDGTTIDGVWFDHTAEYRARLAGREIIPGQFTEFESITLTPIPCWAALAPEDYRGQFTEFESITLTPIPCWAALAPEDYRARVAELVDGIVEEARIARGGRPVLGADAILRQLPTARPGRVDRSPAPAVHAASRAIRLAMVAAYRAFVAAFRAAAERLKRGDLGAVFPAGAFAPPFPTFATS